MSDEPVARIAWFTPLRPVASGISLYNEELLEVLGDHWPIDVYVDGYEPKPFRPFGALRIFPAKEFERRDKRERYATVVYQFGNSPAHAYMYDVALKRPGVVVMHDTVLHHLQLSMISRRGGADRYRRAMSRRYGDKGLQVADQVLRGRLPPSLFDFPLSEDVIDASKQVIVHSEFGLRQIRNWVPNANVGVIPMGIRVPPLIDRDRARAALSLPRNVFVVASITMVNPYKRLDVILRALSRFRRKTAAYMMVAGNVSPHVPLNRWISLYGLEGIVETLGFVDDRTARLVAAAADVLVNLRYPTAGETSASLLRIMAAGRPVLVSDDGSFRELPDIAVAKVPVDAVEEETVEAFLEAFSADPDLSSQIGINARTYIEQHHTLNEMVAGYWRVLRDATGIDLPLPCRVDTVEVIDLELPDASASFDPIMDQIGRAIGDLGLGGDEDLLRDVAESLVDLGLQPDKM